MISNLPLVSICCITYNHCDFIRQCLDGFIMQKTDFAFEIIVHDDASTDGTTDIVKEYEMKYPKLFKVIIQKENQYSKGVNILSNVFSCATGKYIAYCEGDDYWTDPLKLQKQVDVMENNRFSICCHDYVKVDESGRKMSDGCGFKELQINLEDFVRREDLILQPLTVLFRRSMFESDEYAKYDCAKDITLYYHLLKKGDAFIIPEIMGCYRVHLGGVYSSASFSDKLLQDFKTKLAICEVEKSKLSVDYLYLVVSAIIRNLGFRFLVKHLQLFVRAGRQISPYYGEFTIGKILLKKYRGVFTN